MRIKTGFNELLKYPKLTCESQSGPEKPDGKRNSSHCDKNSSHNIGANTDEYP